MKFELVDPNNRVIVHDVMIGGIFERSNCDIAECGIYMLLSTGPDIITAPATHGGRTDIYVDNNGFMTTFHAVNLGTGVVYDIDSREKVTRVKVQEAIKYKI